MQELRSASEASISAASGDAVIDGDDDTPLTDIDNMLFEKYAPIIAQFKVCVIHRTMMHSCHYNNVNISKINMCFSISW